jgi:hypothetical protein
MIKRINARILDLAMQRKNPTDARDEGVTSPKINYF